MRSLRDMANPYQHAPKVPIVRTLLRPGWRTRRPVRFSVRIQPDSLSDVVGHRLSSPNSGRRLWWRTIITRIKSGWMS